MKQFKRILTAPLRLRTSRGFGVHSPFAFSFITNVIRQPYAYYAYYGQNERHDSISRRRRHNGINPVKCQNLVFRTVNYFSPEVIGIIGHGSGLETAAALDPSSRSRAIIYAPGDIPPLFSLNTPPYNDRISIVDSLAKLTDAFTGVTPPLILVNHAAQAEETIETLMNVIDNGGTVIFTSIPATAELWNETNQRLTTHGMTFSGSIIGIITGLRHLPRQSFRLWI